MNGCTSAMAAGMIALQLMVACETCVAAEAAATTPTAAAAPVPSLRVAVTPIASAIDWSDKQPSGVMIDIWEDLAGRLGKATDFVKMPTFVKLMETLPAGTADVALGPLAITEAREKQFDLTHPIFHSGMRIAVRQRENSGFLDALESLVSWDLLKLLGIVLCLALLSGHLLWWFERKGNEKSFPRDYPRGVWEATWWIASTIVTGGCDDKHVDSGLGRAIAYSWMVGGIVLIAALTSMLTATMTAERVTGTIHGVRDLAGRTVGCQAAAVSIDSVRRRGGIVEEFDSIHDALDALAFGMVDAVVADNQQLMYLTNQSNRRTIRLVGPIFDSFDYGIGLPAGSPLREDLNTAILRMREDGTLDRIKEEWLGQHD
jgi:polar amino acid transport system substrate-binding protein